MLREKRLTSIEERHIHSNKLGNSRTNIHTHTHILSHTP